MPRLNVARDEEAFAECDLLIEAIVEDLAAKTAVLAKALPTLPKDAVIASNTSSLSISKIGEALGSCRNAGDHFFNPAPLMPLVEVVAGAEIQC